MGKAGKKRVFPDVDRIRGDTDETLEKRSRRDHDGEGDILSDAPRELQVMKYVQAHVNEIELLNQEVQRDFTGKTTVQKLPRHMQRRAMNHDIRRLPRSVHAAGKAQYENQTGSKRKTPSRFHRRRPQTLLQEYVRRQRKNVWLETHIWHAKRFHMVKKWGYNLATKPTSKSERACYRALSKHCLIQDQSYMCCIEICGSQDAILNGLRDVTKSGSGCTFAATSSISGTREGRTMIYWRDRYPYGAIGPVTFVWKPLPSPSNEEDNNLSVTTATEHRQLWVWCHPSCFNMIWAEFVKCLDLTESKEAGSEDETVNKAKDSDEVSEANTAKDEKSNTQNVTEAKDDKSSQKEASEVKNIKDDQSGNEKATEVNEAKDDKSSHEKESKVTDSKDFKSLKSKPYLAYQESVIKSALRDRFKVSAANSDKMLTMKSLTGSVLRFRLTGPESSTILFDTLHQAGIVPVDRRVKSDAVDESEVFNTYDKSRKFDGVNQGGNSDAVDKTGKSDSWWKSHYANTEAALAHTAQREVIEEMREQSPAELPPCCVVGLTARDPRLCRPGKRTKVVSERTASAVSVGWERITSEVSSSPLWDADVRDEVTETKMSDHDMNERRSAENLVPGTAFHLGNEESRVPVILIQQPASNTTPDPSATGSRGRGAGWDILAPRGWGMPFWQGLVYRGARAGGLEENGNIGFESRTLLFPDEFPDTVAGRREMDKFEVDAVEKYNRRGMSKRVNYMGLGVVSPFRAPWEWLVDEWCGGEKVVDDVPDATEIEVDITPGNDGVDEKLEVRPEEMEDCQGNTSVTIEIEIAPENASVSEKSDKMPENNENCHGATASTMEIDEVIETDVKTSVSVTSSISTTNTFYVLRESKVLKLLQSFSKSDKGKKRNVLANRIIKTKEELLVHHRRALIAVTVDMISRGSVGPFSMVCLPTKEDKMKYKREEKFAGPIEPKHADPLHDKRIRLLREMKEKKLKKKVKVDRQMTVLADREKVNVRNCSRDVIGYLTRGGFSFSCNKGMGKGFVTAPGLMKLLEGLEGSPEGDVGRQKGLVLVRDTCSRQYRLAKLTVLN